MARRFQEDRLVVATHNPGKAREIAALLAPYDVDVGFAAELGLPEPEETGATFRDNAILKARAAVAASGLPALADDSGLAVDRLDGAPGIYSARWAGEERDFGVACARVWRELARRGAVADADRQACFVAVLALAWPDGHVEAFEGRVFGTLVWPPRGNRGFGYDPMFVPAGHALTFGEMDPAEKNKITHRAEAFRKLIDACFRA